ncbi:MAG: hypothetical protein ACYTEZ_10200 [Planctomycetota bacterium]|jgi:hypothetical protein
MSRHILTFFVAFAVILVVMQTCFRKPSQPATLPVEQVDRPDTVFTLTSPGGDATVELAADGSVVSVREGDVLVVRPVPAGRRPFDFIVQLRDDRTQWFPPDQWRSDPAGAGRRFTLEQDEFRIEKTMRLAEDGAGLEVELKVQGAPEQARQFLLGGVTGVPLSERTEATLSAAFWQLGERAPDVYYFQDLLQTREAQPPKPGSGAERHNLGYDETVKRFGVVGRDHYVALEDLPAVSELNLDLFKARREEAESHEIEAYVGLVVGGGGSYEGTFRLRWLPRAELEAHAASLAERLVVTQANTYVLEDERFKVVLTDQGAAIHAMWLKEFSTVAGKDPSEETWVPILREGVRPGERPLTLHADPDRYLVNPAYAVWPEVTRGGGSITFGLETPNGWQFQKRITLPERGRYALGVEIEVRRPDGSAAQTVDYALVGPAGSYIADAYRGIVGAYPPEGFFLERTGGVDEERSIDNLHGRGE